MKLTGTITAVFCLTIFIHGFAQDPPEMLDAWSAHSPIEKVYLHLDRENYIAGETAWFKAYLYSDYQPDTISSVLYVELVGSEGNVIDRSVVPVVLSSGRGHIEIPDTLAGSYTLRSYSPTMLNQEHFPGKQRIFVYGKNKTHGHVVEGKLRLELFPEGGNLFADVANFVAFKATTEKGLPVNFNGKLFNERKEMIAEINSYHDGMGIFEFTPGAKEKYYIVGDQDPVAAKFYLPDPTKKGIGLSLIPHPQGFFFEVKQGTDPLFTTAYMVGQMQHHTVFRQEFKGTKSEIQGIINTKNLHSGILHVTFFNKDHQPLAERLCFVDNKEYKLDGVLITDSLNFSPRAKNKFSVQLKDTVRGSFSVSITDANFHLAGTRDENIFSSLFLTADLNGYVHRPSYYFSNNSDSIKTALDLVMMTNGWRRFRWEELPKKVNTALNYKDPSFITLSGKITLRDSKRPFDEKPLLLMLVTADSTRRVQLISTDKQGNFLVDSMLFFGKSKLMFADIRGKKSQYLDAHLTADSLNRFYQLPAYTIPKRNDLMLAATQSKFDVDYESIYKEKGLLLQGVTVSARKKKTPLEELEEKYTSGAFSTDARKVFDLVNSDEAKYYSTIMDYLRAKGVTPGSRSMPTISAMGDFTTDIYVDEFLTEADLLETIPISKVALIKVYSTFAGSWGAGPGGAIAIYTRKGEDLWNAVDAKPATKVYNGYTITKDFYAPEYSVKRETKEADTRITLDWRPDIFVNNVNPKIPLSFYNNDRTGHYKIVIEGITVDGKILLIEQNISR